MNTDTYELNSLAIKCQDRSQQASIEYEIAACFIADFRL